MSTGKARCKARAAAEEAAELRAQLAEAKETLEAIRTGAIDALVVSGPDGDQVFSLESAETPYRYLFEQINEGALLLRADGVILYANSPFAGMAQAPLEQIIGVPWNRLFPSADGSRLDDLLRRARNNGCREEFALGGQTVTPLPVELSVSFFNGTQTETFSAIVTDLTERKLAQDALHRAISELEHFSFTVVHDLRGPLRVMQTFGAMLEEQCAGRQEPQTLDYLRRINVAAKRMDQLITDSLDYSKAARTELTLEPVVLSELIDDLVDTYPNLQPDQADIQLASGLPAVMGNKTALSQCFSNLLGNAVKFAKSGTRPQIRVRAETPLPLAIDPSIQVPSQMVRVWVEDQGMGIPKSAQNRLFGMFQRANTEREGTGVGLAIVRKVVERMGGRVGVESEEGQGSRFWVELVAAPQNRSMPRSGQVPGAGGPSS